MKQNALTIDVEDYFQVAALAEAVNRDDWPTMEYRVEANTERLLELFSERDVKATFFTLGWVAERSPNLVKKIQRAGHEIASHGYSHQLVYTQTPEVFQEETRKSKRILEDITGEPITGYRAASLLDYGAVPLGSGYPLRRGVHLGFIDIPGSPRSLWHAGNAS